MIVTAQASGSLKYCFFKTHALLDLIKVVSSLFSISFFHFHTSARQVVAWVRVRNFYTNLDFVVESQICIDICRSNLTCRNSVNYCRRSCYAVAAGVNSGNSIDYAASCRLNISSEYRDTELLEESDIRSLSDG